MAMKRFKKDRGIFWDNDKRLNMDETVKILNEQDQTIERYQFIIKDALSRERTQLGQNVLRQLAEALEIEI